MRGRLRSYIPAVGLLTAFAVVALYANRGRHTVPSAELRSPPRNEPIFGLSVSPEEFDLGQVWEQKAFCHRFSIRNSNAYPVRIEKFQTSCACLAVEPASLMLGPDATATIAITLDTTHRSHNEVGLALRDLAQTVAPVVDSETRKRTGPRPGGSHDAGRVWTLTGKVRSRATFDVQSLSFGSEPVHGEKPLTRKVVATLHAPFTDVAARVQPDVARVALKRARDNEFHLFVTPRTDLRPGSFHGELHIEIVNENGTTVDAGQLEVDGELRPEVRPVPARLILEATKVGDVATGMFLLQAPADEDVRVTTVEADCADLTIQHTTVDGVGKGRAFAVSLTVKSAGDISVIARVTVVRQPQTPRQYSMEVSCRGLSKTKKLP